MVTNSTCVNPRTNDNGRSMDEIDNDPGWDNYIDRIIRIPP